MRVIDTATVMVHLNEFSPDEKHWIYNGFDVLMPHEIHNELQTLHDENTRRIYQFELTMRGPALGASLRGMRVDGLAVAKELKRLQAQEKLLEWYFNRLATIWWGQTLNVNSPQQLTEFLYSESGLNLPRQYKFDKGKRKLTAERKALDKLLLYYTTRPIIQAIIGLKEIKTEIRDLKSTVGPDGRMHCTFNPSATETGRWSSSKNPHGHGRNAQNITGDLRRIVVADEGMILANLDLEQAEARFVAYDSNDPDYIQACESGDLHTTTARMVWPELPWNGDLEKDRKIADRQFYRHFSYRDMSKRGGHASNYYGKASTVAKHLMVETSVIEEFQERYFDRFKRIPEWWKEIQRELQATGKLTTPLNRRRTFFGRLNSDETLREAIAFKPQSTISEITKIGILRCWADLEIPSDGEEYNFLADCHDSQLCQVRAGNYIEIVPELIARMTVPVDMPGGTMVIPIEAKIGFRWNHMTPWDRDFTQIRPNLTQDLLDADASLF